MALKNPETLSEGMKNVCACAPRKHSDTQQYLKAEEAENEDDKQSQVRRQQKPNEGRFATDGECVMELVSVLEGVLCLLLFLLSGLFRCHGDLWWGVGGSGSSAGICSFCSELCASKHFLLATICPSSDLHESWQTWLEETEREAARERT